MSVNNYYIHYHYQNYLRFGIESSKDKKMGNGVYDFTQKKQEFIDKINQTRYAKMNINTIARYEEIYKQILNPTLVKGSGRVDKAKKQLFTILNNEIGTALNTKVTDTGAGTISSQQELKRAINAALGIKNDVLNRAKLSDNSATHKAQKIISSFDFAYSKAQSFRKMAMKKGLSVAEINAAIVTLELEINKILQEKDLPTFSSLSDNGAAIDDILKGCIPNKMEHGHPLITSINNLLEVLKSPTISVINGKIGEYVGAVTNVVMNQSILSIDQAVGKAVKQQYVNSPNFKIFGDNLENNFSADNLYNLGSYFNIKAKDFAVNFSSEGAPKNGQSRTKVDIIIDDSVAQNSFKISVKNYNLSGYHYIGLVGDTPLTSLLNEMPEFAAHYLNIVNVHKDSEGVITQRLGGKNAKASDFSGGLSYSQYRKQANDALKLYSLLPAMGGFSGRSKAEYILINDNSQSTAGSVKLISIYDVLKEVIRRDNTGLVSVKVNGTDINKLTTAQLWENTWVGEKEPSAESASARIATLLAQVHSSKISIKISPDVFTTLMYGKSRYAL